MTASKPPTPQAISALLRRSGHQRSEQGGTGYAVATYYGLPGVVAVRHRTWNMRPSEADQDTALAEYAETIRAAGWHVERDPNELVVTAPDGETR